MKMSAESYATLRNATLARMANPEMQAAYNSANLSDERERWDALWAWGPDERNVWFEVVYHDEGLNDNHIDTALRKIQAEARKQ